jgi:hypothetical protein
MQWASAHAESILACYGREWAMADQAHNAQELDQRCGGLRRCSMRDRLPALKTTRGASSSAHYRIPNATKTERTQSTRTSRYRMAAVDVCCVGAPQRRLRVRSADVRVARRRLLLGVTIIQHLPLLLQPHGVIQGSPEVTANPGPCTK